MTVPIGGVHLGEKLLAGIAATGLPLDWTSMLYAVIAVIVAFVRRGA